MHQNDEMPVYPPRIERRSKPRNDPETILYVMQEIHKRVEALDERLSKQTHDATLKLAEEIASLMCKSFPEGDPDGHRAAHEAWIKREEDKAEFWKKMRFEVSRWGIMGLLGWLAIVAWKAVLQGPGK